jgi:hypothetical protein
MLRWIANISSLIATTIIFVLLLISMVILFGTDEQANSLGLVFKHFYDKI